MRANDALSFMERGFHPLSAASYGIPLIAGEVWGLPAAQGFAGPSGTLEWVGSKMKPVKADLAVDLATTGYRLPRVDRGRRLGRLWRVVGPSVPAV
jgi:2-methylcitrate dehydratase